MKFVQKLAEKVRSAEGKSAVPFTPHVQRTVEKREETDLKDGDSSGKPLSLSLSLSLFLPSVCLTQLTAKGTHCQTRSSRPARWTQH